MNSLENQAKKMLKSDPKESSLVVLEHCDSIRENFKSLENPKLQANKKRCLKNVKKKKDKTEKPPRKVSRKFFRPGQNTLKKNLGPSCLKCKKDKKRCSRGNPCLRCKYKGCECVPGTHKPKRKKNKECADTTEIVPFEEGLVVGDGQGSMDDSDDHMEIDNN